MLSTDRIIQIKDPRISNRVSATLNLDTGEVIWIGGCFTAELSASEKDKFEFEWRKNFKAKK